MTFKFRKPTHFGRFWFVPAHSVWHYGDRNEHFLTGAFWQISWTETK